MDFYFLINCSTSLYNRPIDFFALNVAYHATEFFASARATASANAFIAIDVDDGIVFLGSIVTQAIFLGL